MMYSPPAGQQPDSGAWVERLAAKVGAAREKMAGKLAKTASPLDYYTSLGVIREEVNALTPAPVVVAEGANTMDNAR